MKCFFLYSKIEGCRVRNGECMIENEEWRVLDWEWRIEGEELGVKEERSSVSHTVYLIWWDVMICLFLRILFSFWYRQFIYISFRSYTLVYFVTYICSVLMRAQHIRVHVILTLTNLGCSCSFCFWCSYNVKLKWPRPRSWVWKQGLCQESESAPTNNTIGTYIDISLCILPDLDLHN